ncbi:Acetyl-coenzyme A synthetase [Frankliniella fusca]|uniref:Acetyl-coenzyme A synthetase n=1 Tax=Frankliniella fusca TaxID=407009 RepID=A0AAE1L704_9NEOP|nr:Acetyl-coenzyme A synthetase [Frankliniella fusca]KAK3919644.1 Acetyl-coenzyme A synthetase [Frankliniella fusca]KAK3929866.1 Acetyl-coenzyme A synthetase [Frankliniella fusca]KAK3932305.1 Acetyl-coenzyme A synthetase [Frankliniella fusca]
MSNDIIVTYICPHGSKEELSDLIAAGKLKSVPLTARSQALPMKERLSDYLRETEKRRTKADSKKSSERQSLGKRDTEKNILKSIQDANQNKKLPMATSETDGSCSKVNEAPVVQTPVRPALVGSNSDDHGKTSVIQDANQTELKIGRKSFVGTSKANSSFSICDDEPVVQTPVRPALVGSNSDDHGKTSVIQDANQTELKIGRKSFVGTSKANSSFSIFDDEPVVQTPHSPAKLVGFNRNSDGAKTPVSATNEVSFDEIENNSPDFSNESNVSLSMVEQVSSDTTKVATKSRLGIFELCHGLGPLPVSPEHKALENDALKRKIDQSATSPSSVKKMKTAEEPCPEHKCQCLEVLSEKMDTILAEIQKWTPANSEHGIDNDYDDDDDDGHELVPKGMVSLGFGVVVSEQKIEKIIGGNEMLQTKILAILDLILKKKPGLFDCCFLKVTKQEREKFPAPVQFPHDAIEKITCAINRANLQLSYNVILKENMKKLKNAQSVEESQKIMAMCGKMAEARSRPIEEQAFKDILRKCLYLKRSAATAGKASTSAQT